MPGIQSILDEFKAADTQVLGVSVDSRFSHENWANSLGGVSFPLLADFHPKGAVAESYGAYLTDKGITDRATVIIDKQGVVRYAASVTPAGERNPKDLLAECQKVNKK
jgi:alkyl hydroperoxide reductase subunit AhpC